MRNPDLFLARFWAMDAELVSAGWPATSPWWRARIERFFRSGRRRWVLRVGRRGGKSSTLCRVAVAWALFGEWSVPPGDTAVIPFVSIDRVEANERLKTIRAILDVLNVEYAVRGERVDVPSRNMAFRVATCSVGGTVGFTSVAAFADEMARWQSKETSANPAKEVMGSLRPSMATQTSAFEVDSSSPWTTRDYHAVLFDAGDDDHQLADHGATWEANPTPEVSEERTHQLEPDERTWTREYAAIPSDGIENDWFGDAACDPTFTDDQAFWDSFGIRNGMRPIFTIDPAFANDYFGYAVTTSEPADDKRRLTIVQQSGAIKPEGKPRDMLEWVKGIFLKAARDASNDNDGRVTVYTDQAEFYSLREVAQQLDISLQLVTWTGGEHEKSKATRFRAVRTAMRGGEVRIRRTGELYRQFRSVAGVLLPSGNERIEFKRSGVGHCDELSAAMMGLSVALEMPATAAKPIVPVRLKDNPDEWRAKAEREVNERRAREWKRSPQAVLRRAMR